MVPYNLSKLKHKTKSKTLICKMTLKAVSKDFCQSNFWKDHSWSVINGNSEIPHDHAQWSF